MGMLRDLCVDLPRWLSENRWNVDDVDRPLPDVDLNAKLHYHQLPGQELVPRTYSETLWDRPEVDLVTAADRDAKRLKIFEKRYGINALYTDAGEMFRKERLDIVAIATNVKGRADLTAMAVESGVKGILTEKPMAHTLEEADRMVKVCADAGVPICCGSTQTSHPAFATAKQLVTSGAIGEVESVETPRPVAQSQQWSLFLGSAPAWVTGFGDGERRETGSDEFTGQGLLVTRDGLAVHFRKGAASLRITGSKGEIVHNRRGQGFELWQDVATPATAGWAKMSWPGPQYLGSYGTVYALSDIIDCMEGRLDEPKNSARRVAVSLEVEIALKQSSAKGGVRVDLPLEDRSLRLNYDWFR
jgi:hypothetical protein